MQETSCRCGATSYRCGAQVPYKLTQVFLSATARHILESFVTTASNFVELNLTDNRSMSGFYVRGRYLERDMSWREILQLDYGLLIKNTHHRDFTRVFTTVTAYRGFLTKPKLLEKLLKRN